jgi:hypothetical protein
LGNTEIPLEARATNVGQSQLLILQHLGEYFTNQQHLLFSIMRTHTSIGREMLSDSTVPMLKIAADIAGYHHECWNGSGYPEGLQESLLLLMSMTYLFTAEFIRPRLPNTSR